jgi:hypothetical protein
MAAAVRARNRVEGGGAKPTLFKKIFSVFSRDSKEKSATKLEASLARTKKKLIVAERLEAKAARTQKELLALGEKFQPDVSLWEGGG